MAKLEIEDGRTVDIVAPSVQDKVIAQAQYRRRFKTSPTDMVDVMAAVEWFMMIRIFTTLRRNGVDASMPDLMEDDQINHWHARVQYEPGEIPEAEGEQSSDPHGEPEADAPASAEKVSAASTS